MYEVLFRNSGDNFREQVRAKMRAEQVDPDTWNKDHPNSRRERDIPNSGIKKPSTLTKPSRRVPFCCHHLGHQHDDENTSVSPHWNEPRMIFSKSLCALLNTSTKESNRLYIPIDHKEDTCDINYSRKQRQFEIKEDFESAVAIYFPCQLI